MVEIVGTAPSAPAGSGGSRLRRRAVVGVAVLAIAALAAGSSAAPGFASPSAGATTTSVTGTVQEVVVDEHPGRRDPHGHHGAEKIEKLLQVGEKTIELAPGSLPNADNGDKVTVTLAPAADGAQRVVSARTVEAAGAEDPVDPAMRDVHVAIVLPSEAAEDPSITPEAVTEMVNSASTYWSSQTDGKVKFRVAQILPVYESAYSCEDGVNQMWNEAAPKLNIPNVANQHMMLVAPREASEYMGCPYGWGMVGEPEGAPAATFVADLNQSIFAHELGHNLGLRHSNALHCATQDATHAAGWPATCTNEEYGDLFDVMGYSGPNFGEGSLNAVHLDRMGLLPSAVQTITAEGVHNVTLAPISAEPTATRAVKVMTAEGIPYYIEYRTNSGLDTVAGLNFFEPALGVRVLRPNPSAAESSSYVLDATPTGVSRVDAEGWVWHDYQNTVAPGAQFTNVTGSLAVRVESQTAAGAQLVIQNGTSHVVPAPMVPVAVGMEGVPVSAVVGTTLRPATTVSNADGKPVSGWDMQLQFMADGAIRYSTVRTLRTDAAGRVSTTVVADGGGMYRYVSVARPNAPAVVGPAVRLDVENRPARVILYGLPTRAAHNSAVTASARVINRLGKPVPGWVVRLQVVRKGTRSWVTVGDRLTDGYGRVAVRFGHSTGASYRFVALGANVVSNVQTVATQAVVRIKRPATTVRRGKYVYTSGSVTRVPSQVVYLQVRLGKGRWSSVRATVRGTTVTAKYRMARRGTYQVRYYFAADRYGRYLGGYSSAYTVRVR